MINELLEVAFWLVIMAFLVAGLGFFFAAGTELAKHLF